MAGVWSGNAERYTIWENEIFNRSVGTIYDLGPRFSGGLAETATTVDSKSGLLLAGGKPVTAAYALTDGSLELGGRVIARDRLKGMLLYRVGGPLRQLSQVVGLYPRTPGREPRCATRATSAGAGRFASCSRATPRSSPRRRR